MSDTISTHNQQHIPRKWFFIALINFLIAALAGTVLRFIFVTDIPGITFPNLMHAHSHTAMLGWVYLALFTLLIRAFLPNEEEVYRRYNRLFWITQISVIGMFVAFFVQGYGPVSIAFSSIHGILSYVFIYKFWRDLGKPSPGNLISFRFAKASMVFLVISTLALWAMPVIIVTGASRTAIYYASIQFYLHFQFNGWFIFAILALFFHYLESRSISFSIQGARHFFRLLFISCILTYVLAVTWSNPIPALFYINSTGVIIQLGALFIFIMTILPSIPVLRKHLANPVKRLFGFTGLCFMFKVLIQSAVIIPAIAQIGYTIRVYVLGFLHLMLLGMISGFLLGFATFYQFIRQQPPLVRLGIWLFLLGFIGSEGYLFLQGTLLWAQLGFLPAYYEGIAIVSALIPIGILFILIPQLGSEK